MMSVDSRSRIHSIVAVAVVASLAVSCATDTGRAPAASPDRKITDSLDQWFTGLARQPLATQPKGESGLEFALTPSSPLAPDDLPLWLVDLRPNHPQALYRLAALHISPADPPALNGVEYDTRFALERDTVDSDGVAHIARWQQHWRIRLPVEGPPVVVSVDQEPRLIFPGTGPQIVCF